ncbi:Response regulator receiver protein [Tepidanaerobacter acetatoxydans Re1]|uniref:Stage 0 sporulation protein A homolog n=1 Tax=Tepidanaerobacter acetatoxydans (strain DSM 21804 / JCM 16047 / Re1) TaxID=1209989 RepID=F4LX06_TEPAE|nr:response regulator [Tepidanaerobacter acetatoxydans]AEE90984.1 response regulator receiver protein [Tepidanaerobacter acetatoxydans Re1]CDI40502.1 Response regulator receiver protein [Tepidanaerobacter acetatoxydans Re1]
MNFRVMIVDDDRAVRRILSGIIENNNLGDIVGDSGDGEEAEKKISVLKPDIVLMDFLLPSKDGLEIIKSLKKRGINTHFIMISQVEDQAMISQAYQAGIEFFIHKPINAIETVSVISKVQEIIKLKDTVNKIRTTVINLDDMPLLEVNIKKGLNKVGFFLADLGILGETGSEDIKIIIENHEKFWQNINNLQDIYQYLKQYYENYDEKKSTDIKAIEMRIRRAIDKALKNVASMGLEDYNNEQFIRFASTLFDFTEVKKEMDFLRGKSPISGKINIKKFLEGSILLCKT